MAEWNSAILLVYASYFWLSELCGAYYLALCYESDFDSIGILVGNFFRDSTFHGTHYAAQMEKSIPCRWDLISLLDHYSTWSTKLFSSNVRSASIIFVPR
jgi:hypothetical protein